MKIERSSVTMLTITGAPNLDPVRVIVENYEPGRGRIIIQCYDRAWVGYWGAMGSALEPFFISAHPDYIAGNLTCGLSGMRKDAAKHAEPYLRRIIEAVQAAFRQVEQAAASSEGGGEVIGAAGFMAAPPGISASRDCEECIHCVTINEDMDNLCTMQNKVVWAVCAKYENYEGT